MDRLVEMIRLHRLGIPDKTVARMLHMGPNTHRHARNAFRAAGLWDGTGELPAYETLRELLPQRRPPQQISEAEPWRDRIEEMAARGLEATAIHTRLSLEIPDFPASYASIKRLVVTLRRTAPTSQEQVVIPVETGPGEVAQVDFAYVGRVLDPSDGVRKKAWFFLMTLGYSRHFYTRVVFDQTAPTWLDLHVRAFAFFGGVPRVIVPDNLKSAVIRTSFGPDRDLEAQRTYRELARHYGFLIDPTPPRSPQKKGKVERNVAYVEGFLASRSEDSNRDELNEELERWNRQIASLRVHGTTGRAPWEMFLQEKPSLLPLSPTPYLSTLWRHTRVQPNAHALFERHFYSVPWQHLGKDVWIRAIPDRIFLYVDDHLVAEHPRKSDGGYSTLPGHLPERAALAQRNPEVWKERASRIGCATRSWVDFQFLEGFDYSFNPTIPREKIAALGTCAFLGHRRNVIFVGPTGTGKSHLAQALGHRACRLGHAVQYLSATELLGSLRTGRGDGSYDRKLDKLAKVELLIIDDLGLRPLRGEEPYDFHEIVRRRHEKHATILTSNRDVDEWGEIFPEPLLAAATLDRLLEGATVIPLVGDSYRNPPPEKKRRSS